ncbi:uncharacterized protein VTP21DRAFT_7128 [Calcarisporiella thermophila]|uniref:uncharacterized protein n=1 Tax=Calcarisporiella thermophila TaxID=911321 RepID=UPI003743DF61
MTLDTLIYTRFIHEPFPRPTTAYKSQSDRIRDDHSSTPTKRRRSSVQDLTEWSSGNGMAEMELEWCKCWRRRKLKEIELEPIFEDPFEE